MSIDVCLLSSCYMVLDINSKVEFHHNFMKSEIFGRACESILSCRVYCTLALLRPFYFGSHF